MSTDFSSRFSAEVSALSQESAEARTPADVLHFWFESHGVKDWFQGGSAFDERIHHQLGSLYASAIAGACVSWETSPEGRLALLLLWDQCSRNLYRDSPDAFAQDLRARALCLRALRYGDDFYFKHQACPETYRTFLYMPLMHSERLADQRRCLDLFLTHGPEFNVAFARQHLDVIQRFGRFPHRNAVLGRTSTAAERRFLAVGGASF